MNNEAHDVFIVCSIKYITIIRGKEKTKTNRKVKTKFIYLPFIIYFYNETLFPQREK